ncbi:MAG: OmpA family protein [Arcobacteraceae bacterium]
MSLPNKIILLLLLLVVFITICVYTKAEQIFNELTVSIPTTVVEETQPAETQQEQFIQDMQAQQQVAIEEAVQDAQIQQQEEALLPTPLTPEEEFKKVQGEVVLKDESVVETQENMEKTVEQNLDETQKQNAEVSNNESLQAQINTLLVNNSIVFQRMSSNIANESKETLEKIAKIIIDNPTIKIEIAGHTDAKGDDSFNQTVSEQRANSVKSRLVELGVNADRLVAKGYGKTKPLVANDEEGYSLANRRVEFNIIEE